jgi:hypothetical protein
MWKTYEQMAMLKWSLIKRDEKTWHDFVWFRIEIGGGMP